MRNALVLLAVFGLIIAVGCGKKDGTPKAEEKAAAEKPSTGNSTPKKNTEASAKEKTSEAPTEANTEATEKKPEATEKPVAAEKAPEAPAAEKKETAEKSSEAGEKTSSADCETAYAKAVEQADEKDKERAKSAQGKQGFLRMCSSLPAEAQQCMANAADKTAMMECFKKARQMMGDAAAKAATAAAPAAAAPAAAAPAAAAPVAAAPVAAAPVAAAPAAAAPAAAAPVAAAPVAAGAVSKLNGTWKIDVDALMNANPEMQKQIAANPQAKAMMDKAMGAMSFTFANGVMSATMGSKSEKASYKVKSTKGNTIVLETTPEGKDKIEDITVTFIDDAHVTLSKANERMKLTLIRSK